MSFRTKVLDKSHKCLPYHHDFRYDCQPAAGSGIGSEPANPRQGGMSQIDSQLNMPRDHGITVIHATTEIFKTPDFAAYRSRCVTPLVAAVFRLHVCLQATSRRISWRHMVML